MKNDIHTFPSQVNKNVFLTLYVDLEFPLNLFCKYVKRVSMPLLVYFKFEEDTGDCHSTQNLLLMISPELNHFLNYLL